MLGDKAYDSAELRKEPNEPEPSFQIFLRVRLFQSSTIFRSRLGSTSGGITPRGGGGGLGPAPRYREARSR